jgi:hypothetical protein
MRWQNKRLSDNVEDRRRGGGMRNIGIGGGIGGIIIIVLALLFNKDPQQVLQQVQPGGASTETSETVTAGSDESARMASTVLASTEDVWTQQFTALNKTYTPPKMVLFSNATESGCGFAQSAMGPFYCPADDKVYLDLTFFDEMRQRFNVVGDFAQAYVIAHEVGHHVQNLLGISDKLQAMRSRLSVRPAAVPSPRSRPRPASFGARTWPARRQLHAGYGPPTEPSSRSCGPRRGVAGPSGP